MSCACPKKNKEEEKIKHCKTLTITLEWALFLIYGCQVFNFWLLQVPINYHPTIRLLACLESRICSPCGVSKYKIVEGSRRPINCCGAAGGPLSEVSVSALRYIIAVLKDERNYSMQLSIAIAKHLYLELIIMARDPIYQYPMAIEVCVIWTWWCT